MTTPITKERLEELANFRGAPVSRREEQTLARIALATMGAEPVADVVAWHKEGEERTCDIRLRRFDVAPGPLFAVSQPVATVPTFDEWLEIRGNKPLGWVKDAMRESYDACRAAMLLGGKS